MWPDNPGGYASSHPERKSDLEAMSEEIITFTRRIVVEAQAGGVVVGLSGGVDSSLVAALSAKALGKERVLGVLLPMEFTPAEDIQDAKDLARLLGIETEYSMIQPVVDSFAAALRVNTIDSRARIPLANICS